MSETVFVFGAGFSVNANIPAQERIMKSIPTAIKRRKYYYYEAVCGLYKKLYHHTDTDQMEKIPLEDVFTYLDRAVSNNETTDTLTLSESRNG
jgi:hypothetical protein